MLGDAVADATDAFVDAAFAEEDADAVWCDRVHGRCGAGGASCWLLRRGGWVDLTGVPYSKLIASSCDFEANGLSDYVEFRVSDRL